MHIDNLLANRNLVAAIIFLVFPVTIALIWSGKSSYTTQTRTSEMSDAPDFKSFPAGPRRKEVFFEFILPMVVDRNDELMALRTRLLELQQQDKLSTVEVRELEKIATRFRMKTFSPDSAEDWELLLRRVDYIPPSLALAQAANESAWGTSRFAVKGNNYFGQWCWEKGCGIVPSSRGKGKQHEVKVFESPNDAVIEYMRNLNTHNAYMELRDIREELRDKDMPVTGIALAAGLTRYSERGDHYIEELRQMIRYNKLTQHDEVSLQVSR